MPLECATITTTTTTTTTTTIIIIILIIIIIMRRRRRRRRGKRVLAVETSCPWMDNKTTKDKEKTAKYAQCSTMGA